MAVIHYNNQAYPTCDDETLLETLLRHNVEFPFSCKIGTCQSCLTKLIEGDVSTDAQKGLKPTWVAKQYFLACQCHPQNDMTIALPEHDDTAWASKIISLSKLNHNVLQVRLSFDQAQNIKAGQYINLMISDNIVRSYSVANVPGQYLELHIKLLSNGLMSEWLCQQAHVSSPVYIRGPMGECFYHNPEKKSFPIVLAGTGTGLAPLIGIVRDALENNHDGQIILIHGGVTEVDLYLHETLTQLQNAYPHFEYVPCVLRDSKVIRNASIDDVLLEKLETIKNICRLFVCGPEETTKKLKIKAFLAGVPSSAIYSDSFVTAFSGNAKIF